MSLETINLQRIGMRPGDKILDLGCGEGRHAISMFLLADVHVTGIDLSDKDLGTANSRLADFTSHTVQPHKSCIFAKADGRTLPFPDNTFDQVICAEVLEHIPQYQQVLGEIKRVLKPGGIFAASVPRYFPEWICWQLSDAYHEVAGGHVRIFRSAELKHAIESQGMRRFARHWAHSLHVPYWWLRCTFWQTKKQVPIVELYHRFLIWDLMQKPLVTRMLDKLLNPIMGKSIVMYFCNEQ